MKIFSLLAFVVGLASASIDVDDGTISQRVRFEAWIKKHKMIFEGVEFMKAWFTWVDNDKLIQEVNAQGLSYKLGHNRFSHMTPEEWVSTYGKGGLSKSDMHTNNETVDWTLADPARQADAPSSWDWVSQGAVTPPKDQGVCFSCWAFSVTGAVESAFKIAGYTLLPFSEEQLVACDTKDYACRGGHYRTAFRYVKSKGLCIEPDYPYGADTKDDSKVGTCQTTCSPLVKIGGFSNVPTLDENSLKVAVYQQPVNVAVDGENAQWQFYRSGVMDNSFCTQNVNHAVLAVGYGSDYWKIKNSWGEDWGEDGYIRLKFGSNTCGVSIMPSFPTGIVATRQVPSSVPHYGDPSAGKCRDDETIVKSSFFPGRICAPLCDNRACPTDMPSSMSGNPICVTGKDGVKQCVLTCNDSDSNQCGAARCRDLSHVGYDVGLCTYDSTVGDSSSNRNAFELSFNQSTSVILK